MKLRYDVLFCNFSLRIQHYTGNPPYLGHLVQWHITCRTLRSASANLLSVTHCNISFGAQGFHSAAPAIWNSLSSNERSCETVASIPPKANDAYPFFASHSFLLFPSPFPALEVSTP